MNYLQDKVEDMATSLENKLATVDSKVEKNIKAVTENIKSLQTEYQKVNKVVENKFNMQDSESNSGIKEELKQVKDLITNQIEKQTLHGKLNDIKDKLLNVEKQLNNKRTLDEEVHFFKSQLKDKTDNFTIEIHECKHLPGDCKDVQERGYNESGIYRIQPRLSNDSFLVWCDMVTRGGGWVSVLKRVDGSQNFYLNWNEYKNGFGSLPGEHWVGLDHLSELTSKFLHCLVHLYIFFIMQIVNAMNC